jgi:hypothetical protein
VGARHGLRQVAWRACPSDALRDLRRVLGVDPDERRRRVADIASRLQLQHLTSFFDRIAIPAP